jgi:hypothetical protein
LSRESYLRRRPSQNIADEAAGKEYDLLNVTVERCHVTFLNTSNLIVHEIGNVKQVRPTFEQSLR